MADLSVNIGELQMNNPVMTASGTFGYGEEFADFIELSRIGGIIVKGTTLHKREGNPYPRMAETPSGMLNAVGLQNKGVHYFVEHIYPRIKDIQTNMIVNVSGSAIEDYAETAAIINELDKIPAIELNISCPNVKQGGMAFGVTAKGAEEVVKAVRSVYKKTLIVKLSPNVTDITEIARAAENGGADSVSLINTLLGMAIDAERRRPILSVGLQNKGVHYFVEHIYPRIKDIQTNMIVNVSGSAIEDYAETAAIINELDKIPAIELNISCPNVKQGGMAFGVTAKGAEEVVKAVRSVYKKTLIVKLSPNVTDITEIARAAENGGADSVSLINTLLGMAIDAERRRPILSTVTGGMSGAAVKPIALRMVWQVAKAVKIPVIGLGGIMNWKDAVEFMLAGASAIQIGTANFIDPAVTVKVVEGINDYLDRHGYQSIKDIIGALEV